MRAWMLALLLVTAAIADDGLVITKIEINGLRSTKSWVVERELHFSVGDTVSRAELWNARKRLQNLSVFNDVWMGTSRDGLVRINVSEIWPLWPILQVNLQDGQLGDVVSKPKEFFRNATIYAGARHLNFRGNAGQVYSQLQFGASQGFDLGYRTRWLAPRLPLAVRIYAANLSKSDPHPAVIDSTRYLRETRYSIDISPREGARTRPGVELRYQAIAQDKTPPAEGLHQRTYWFSPYIIFDRRDLEWYPSEGSRTEVRVDLATGDAHFIRSYYDLRGYFAFWQAEPRRAPVLALRAAAATSSSETPSWAHFYHGFNVGLRGYRRIKSEEAGFILGEAEVRWPIGPEGYYNVPLIGRYGRHWPWGLYGFGFVQRTQLTIDTHRDERLSAGGGFYLRMPYIDLVQVSLAVRRRGGHEFSFTTGLGF